jgi:CRISPR system Cascade subunit CasA
MADDEEAPHFNLFVDEWVPVVYLDGRCEEVSIETLLRDSCRIREIGGDSKQQDLPILRLALAILTRALSKGGARSEDELLDFWEETWAAHAFDMDAVLRYVSPLIDRFDLFYGRHPFFQVAGLEYTGKAPDGIGELVADIPKDEKFLFSLRDRNRIEDLSFAEAARWLVFQQAYATAGIKTPVKGNTHVTKGKVYPPKGAVGTGMLGAIGGLYLEGRNLFETLMLNWVLMDDVRAGAPIVGCEEDVPAWERDAASSDYRVPGPAEPYGPVQCYTWASRRLRLVLDEDGKRVVGVVSCYGDIPNVLDRDGSEPMTAWRPSPAQQKRLGLPYVPRMPKVHDPSRAIWRGLASIVSVGEGGDLRPGVVRWVERLRYEGVFTDEDLPVVAVHAQGMVYGTQNSVFTDAVDDRFDMSVSLIDHGSSACAQALDTIDLIDQAVGKVVNFVSNTQRAAGDKASSNVAKMERERVRETVYSVLDADCRARLARFPEEVDEVQDYCTSWKGEVRGMLLTYATRYMSSCERSFFEEHDGMTVGRAMALLRASLYELLGRPVDKAADLSEAGGASAGMERE